jgi:hypothetical protein
VDLLPSKIGNAFALQVAMRNVLGSFAVAVVATLGVSVPAAASTIAYQDTFEPAPVFLSAASDVACTGTNALADTVVPGGTLEFPCLSLWYSHQLTNLGEFDTLDSATLTVYFIDDAGNADGSEKFTLTGDGTPFWTTEEPGGGGNSEQAYGPLSVFAQVQGDQTLDILVTANVGDLYFLRSTLDYVITHLDSEDPELVPTPEPASLLLFGAGAIMIAARVRKARRS